MKNKNNSHHKGHRRKIPKKVKASVVEISEELKPHENYPKKILQWRHFVYGGLIGTMIYSLSFFQRPSRSNKRYVDGLDYRSNIKVFPTITPTLIPVVEPVFIPVLTYHYVEYDRDKSDWKRVTLTTHPDVLEEQFKTLKEYGYTTYFAEEVPQIVKGQKPLMDRGIVLTFDDGYEDFYTDVFPLLKKYNLKATQYVIYDYIDEKGFLTKKQIRELIDSGLVEIGSHTLDHVWLKTTDDREARRQVIASKRRLESLFHITVNTFCYPAGGYDDRILRYVDEAGYTAAFSTLSGVYQTQSQLKLVKRIRTAASGEHLIRTLEEYKAGSK